MLLCWYKSFNISNFHHIKQLFHACHFHKIDYSVNHLQPYLFLVKSFFTFFLQFLQTFTAIFFPQKGMIFDENGQNHFVLTSTYVLTFLFQKCNLYAVFWGAYMSVDQKLTMLKICSTSVTFLSLRNLEAAPEEAMQLRRLIKSSNESLVPYLFGKIEFWNF